MTEKTKSAVKGFIGGGKAYPKSKVTVNNHWTDAQKLYVATQIKTMGVTPRVVDTPVKVCFKKKTAWYHVSIGRIGPDFQVGAFTGQEISRIPVNGDYVCVWDWSPFTTKDGTDVSGPYIAGLFRTAEAAASAIKSKMADRAGKGWKVYNHKVDLVGFRDIDDYRLTLDSTSKTPSSKSGLQRATLKPMPKPKKPGHIGIIRNAKYNF